MRKRLLVLARSFKIGGYCVAGREVLVAGPRPEFGPWLRPINGHTADGSLDLDRVSYADGRALEVGQVAGIDVVCNAGNHFQPENWVMAASPEWRREIVEPCATPWSALEERPTDLWLQTWGDTDRIAHSTLEKHLPEQSLYLIRPRELRFQPDPRPERPRWRAVFRYGMWEYNLALTDPAMLARLPQASTSRQVASPWGDRCLLCVSLADDYHGWHHKLVATVIPTDTT